MDLLGQPQVKKKYDEYKLVVKVWEHEFKKKHKRLPSKLDIREASTDVRTAYRKYFQLKTAALEQSFSGVDGFNSDDENEDASKNADVPFEKNTNANSSTESYESNDEFNIDENLRLMENEPDPICTTTDDTWGQHLNVTKKEEPVKSESKTNLNVSLTQKLFCGSKFSKRNPRKSMSFSQRKSEVFNSPVASSQSFALPNEDSVTFESTAMNATSFTLSSNISKPSQTISIVQSVLENERKALKTVDIGWLDRVIQSTGGTPSGEKKKLLFAMASKVDSGSEDIVDESEDEGAVKDPKIVHVAKKAKIVTSDDKENSLFKHSQSSSIDKHKITDCFTSKAKQEEPPPISFFNKLNSKPHSLIGQNIEKKQSTLVPDKSSQNIEINKEILGSTEITNVPVRRSGRNNKRVNLQESCSEEEPFPPSSPEFVLEPEVKSVSEKTRKKTKSTKIVKEKNPTNKTRKKTKSSKIVKDKNPTNTVEESEEIYELEYNVKPRVVAPRISNIKKILSKSMGDKNSKPKSANKASEVCDKLEEKVSSAKPNENFVRLNLKKKIFVRGKKNMNFSKHKKNKWKQLMKNKSLYGPDMDMRGCDGGMLTCFTCGQIGHFAQNCKATKGDGLLPLETNVEEECPYPTLEQASQMTTDSIHCQHVSRKNLYSKHEEETDEQDYEGDNSNDEIAEFDDLETSMLLEQCEVLEKQIQELNVEEYVDNMKYVEPYYQLEDGKLIATPTEVFEALKKFGHDTFRSGQEQAIMRILSGQSTLVTLSTGSGKSLCYQLPALLYSQRKNCISLVISPLVSLMEDQVTGVPSFLNAACLHTNQTKVQRDKVITSLEAGELNILLISPEAVVAGEKQTGYGSILRKLPPIAFACIDEAHCVSQWSHNFRPSYLMICRVLRECLGIKVILGLTATATQATKLSIINHIHVPDGLNGIVSERPLPDNLSLFASKDKNRDRALLDMLMSEPYKSCQSIIIYCTRRDECERIASYLRTSMRTGEPPKEPSKKRQRENFHVEPYHAGLVASRRRVIQKSFMSGKLRIVVATVAFGMGINKSDIRAVIHYNMPKSFESYVQEVGRAGRDGLPAFCHLFLDSEGRDENELRRHIYGNSIDRHAIRRLLQRIFIPCSCKNECPKHEVAFSIEETVQSLDVPEENISTLLCYLELHEKKYLHLLSPGYTLCKLISYGGPLQIRKAAKDCPPLAMALALHKKPGENENLLEFPIIELASIMGWDSGICKHQLKNLEFTREGNVPKRSPISVRFSNLGFRMLAPGNLTDEQLDEALDSLYNRVQDQERTALLQLHAVHNSLTEVAAENYKICYTDTWKESCFDKLKNKIREYFELSNPFEFLGEIPFKPVNEEVIVSDIRMLINMYKDNSFTGRAVARIFHGIQSPNYPAVIWGRCKFWRKHLHEDFQEICKIATKVIFKMRS